MKKLVLIDSNALVHRAFHALPLLTSPKGVPTNAVYGFMTILLKMIGTIKPDYIAAAFDLAGPTFRHAMYEQYKAHREKAPDELYAQIPVVKDMLKTMGIPVFEAKGFEADDVIGTLAELAKKDKNVQVIIVTGDLDTLQLVDKDRVIVFTLRRGMSDTIVYNEKSVIDRFGLTPKQMNDFKGLKGDSSDNIPGVPGVGEKTASTLIGEHKTLEKLYDALKGVQKAQGDAKKVKALLPQGMTEKLAMRLLEHKEGAFSAKELVTIVRDVPLEFDIEAADWSRHVDAPALKTLSNELGFYSMVKKLDRSLAQAMPEAPRLELGNEGTSSVTVYEISSAAGLPDTNEAALHTVLTDEGTLRSICIATSDTEVGEWKTDRPGDLAAVLERYPLVIGHDIKRLLKTAEREDLDTSAWFDTKIAAWLIAPDLRDHDLERVAFETLEHYLEEDPCVWPTTIGRLYSIQQEKLASLGLEDLMMNIEMPLVGVLARMEKRGIRIDTAVLTELSAKVKKDLAKLEKAIYKRAEGEFNINSPSQLGHVLFEKLGIKGRIRRTPQGALSTAAGELEKIRDAHPIVDLILQYRELSKLANTYIEPFPSLIAGDGRIHTTYNQTGTATGRLSSQDPNLQNIPTRTELGRQFRAAFVSKRGFELISLDYSQIELRIVAHIADDKTMKDAFLNGEDIHARTASVVFNVSMDKVTPAMRRQAKVLNFGIIYGMGVMGFSRAAGVSRDEARQFMDDYFERFSGVANYMERTRKQAAEQGYVATLLDRRRPLPDIVSRLPQLVAQAERMAVNHPIQGTNADIMKIAMLKLDSRMREQYGEKAQILLQIHDELVFEVKKDLVPKVALEAKKIMEEAYALSIPLVIDVKHGMNWTDMKPLVL